MPLWVRVTVAGSERYEVFFVVLYVEDCTPTCNETDVDEYLMTTNCHWAPVNVGGSDDFSTYKFEFYENQQLIVVDGDGNEVEATWSTISGTAGGTIIVISGLDGVFAAFNGEWTVTNCNVERLDLKNTSDNTEVVLLLGC